MYSLVLQIDEEDQDPVIARLWDRGTEGIVQKYEKLEAFFRDDSARQDLLTEFAEWKPEIVEQPEVDWVSRTEESFPAMLVGERFFLVPPWNNDPVPPGRFRLEINPGLACGTGWHPCTRLCLRALEQHVRPGSRVLDVGTGSGILSIAAGLLGAGPVIACDIDPQAVFVARERLTTPLFIGSVNAIRPGSFDLLVANISAAAAEDLFPEFRRVADRLILSGFEDPPQLPQPAVAMLEEDGWYCLVS